MRIKGGAPVTSGMTRRFNRDTGWLATGVLGTVAFAALMVALQERHARPDDLTKEAWQTTADLVLNANPAAISDVVGSNEKSTGETTSGGRRALILDSLLK